DSETDGGHAAGRQECPSLHSVVPWSIAWGFGIGALIPNPQSPSARRGRRLPRAHVRQREGPLVGELGDPFVRWSIAVRSLRLDSKELRSAAALCRPQRPAHL